MSTILQQEKDTRTDVKLPDAILKEIDSLREELKIPYRTDTIAYLVNFFRKTWTPEGIQIATFQNIINPPGRRSDEDPPAAIVGRPGEGKSYTLDKLLRECDRKRVPFILFNSSAPMKGKRKQPIEHEWIEKKLSMWNVESMTWIRRPQSIRIQMDERLAYRQEAMKSFSERLLQAEGEPKLKEWVLVFEEAHDYGQIFPFMEVLRRMRKYVRKMIVVTTEANLFGMCQSYRPLPRKRD